MNPSFRALLRAKLDEVESLEQRLNSFASQIGKGAVAVTEEHESFPQFMEMRNTFNRANADLDAFVRTISKNL